MGTKPGSANVVTVINISSFSWLLPALIHFHRFLKIRHPHPVGSPFPAPTLRIDFRLACPSPPGCEPPEWTNYLSITQLLAKLGPAGRDLRSVSLNGWSWNPRWAGRLMQLDLSSPARDACLPAPIPPSSSSRWRWQEEARRQEVKLTDTDPLGFTSAVNERNRAPGGGDWGLGGGWARASRCVIEIFFGCVFQFQKREPVLPWVENSERQMTVSRKGHCYLCLVKYLGVFTAPSCGALQ